MSEKKKKDLSRVSNGQSLLGERPNNCLFSILRLIELVVV